MIHILLTVYLYVMQVAPMTRVDKADILELTVFHLTRLQQHAQAAKMAADAAAYNTGYRDCAREAVTYLASGTEQDGTIAPRLSDHLHHSYMQSSGGTRHEKHTIHAPVPMIASTLNQGGNAGLMSTPVRDNTATKNMDSFTASDFSPIVPPSCQKLLKEYSNISIDLSASMMSASVGAVSADSGFESLDDTGSSGNTSNVVADGCVAIGGRHEDKIGHVIEDAMWRPW